MTHNQTTGFQMQHHQHWIKRDKTSLVLLPMFFLRHWNTQSALFLSRVHCSLIFFLHSLQPVQILWHPPQPAASQHKGFLYPWCRPRGLSQPPSYINVILKVDDITVSAIISATNEDIDHMDPSFVPWRSLLIVAQADTESRIPVLWTTRSYKLT